MWLKIFFALAALMFALSAPALTHAQNPIVIETQTLEMNFPNSMRFTLQASSRAPIQVMRLTVWQRGVALGSRFTPPFTPAPTARAVFVWNFQSFSFGGYLPPGARGEYTWRIEDADGNVYDTPRAAFVIEDPSQKWQTLSNENLRVSWHAGDANFGTAIFTRAVMARDFFARELQIENVEPLEIFIYADNQEFFNSLPPFSAEWTGGRMFPEHGVIMINFAPESLEWGLRATSHELSHAILRAKIRGTIGALSMPRWLDEGLAVYNETDDHAPDEQFEAALQPAIRRNTLIPLRAMQQRFPEDSAQAQLAYGISYSVVRFMIQAYGEGKFAELLAVYQRGSLPDEGMLQVYGMNQDELENAWRKQVGAPAREISTARMPTLAPRPTFEFSSATIETPTAPLHVTPSPEATQIAAAATPPPANSVPAQPSEIPASSVCGGILLLGGIATLSYMTRRSKKSNL